MSIEGERHIEMTWRCSACSNVNLGRYKSCQSCSKPKDASEEYEMPLDIEAAVSVTDEALLRMATAGPDWRCAYCGSDQRATSGACGTCGASPTKRPDAPAPALYAPPERKWWQRDRDGITTRRWPLVIAGGGALVIVVAIAAVWLVNRPRNYTGVVTAANWERVVTVEHYALHDHEGFQEAIPSSAVDVTSAGQKIHHYDQIYDHTETETYSVQVDDGFHSETYFEQVPCGQTCTSTPQMCSQQCTSSNNGFASCRTVCSGGTSNCMPKYCSEARTRQIPQTRSEMRTRQVPKYRSEPRYAESFTYKAWDWRPDRTVKATGGDVVGLAWPANGAKTEGLPAGEQERETRGERYTVTLSFHDETIEFAVPNSDVFERYAVHTEHEVRREAGEPLRVDGKWVTPL